MIEQFWIKLSKILLGHPKKVISLVAMFALIMAYFACKVVISYELPKILPQTDPNFQLYENFKKKFGEDGNVLVLGIETNKIFEEKLFNEWATLNQQISALNGVKRVANCTNVKKLVKNETDKSFNLISILPNLPAKQAEIDSLQVALAELPVYEGFLYNQAKTAHLTLITIDSKVLNGKERFALTDKIKEFGNNFGARNKLEVHYSGMPFVRSEFSKQVSNELKMFLLLAIAVTCVILALFFRSLKIVLCALLVILTGIASTLAFIYLLGYQITLLSGLIPALVIVIGVPNIIFLVNKYHEEYSLHSDKLKSLETSIQKIGPTLFLANVTTFIGFGVFVFTNSKLLLEFGAVASINIMLTFMVTIVLIPTVFSLISTPTKQNLSHLEGKRITKIISSIEKIVMKYRTRTYWTIGLISAISVYGLYQIKAIGYVVDDLPKGNKILSDLHWTEQNFNGIVPFEVSIDTKEVGGALQPQTLTKIRRTEKALAQIKEFTRPVSLVTATKYVYQAYRGGEAQYFVLPGIDELQKLQEYKSAMGGGQNEFAGFLDSNKQHTRISLQMKDAGTVRTKQIVKQLQPKIDSIFNYDPEKNTLLSGEESKYDVRVTGNGVVFALGNEYLLKNLIESTVLAIVLISIIMALLFLNWRMVIISILPSVIPLLITAGIMGYFNIALKPSTILIFSIAFGISSDGTIYFLTRYKDELKTKNITILEAISNTIQNTGVSMFYTAVILFCGFFIFSTSTFKGTQALGVLVSLTLLCSMICNLILLPAFIATIDKKAKEKEVR
jgi:uncharacterized protein